MRTMKNRIMVNSITWILCLAFLGQGIGWTAPTADEEIKYLSPESEFLKPASLFNTKAWLVMDVILHLIKRYPGDVDIELLNRWVKGYKLEQGDLADVLVVPYDESSPAKVITILGNGFRINFLPADISQRGNPIPGSTIYVEIIDTVSEAYTAAPKLLPSAIPPKKSLTERLRENIAQRVRRLQSRYPSFKRLMARFKGRVDLEKERKWVLSELRRYGTVTASEGKEIIAELSIRDVWDRFEEIFRYAEDERLTMEIIDYLYIILTDSATDDFIRNKVLSLLFNYLEDSRPNVLRSITMHLLGLYKEYYTRGIPYLSSSICQRISEEIDRFVIRRVPQLLKVTYSKEGFTKERQEIYRILGMIYSKVHSLAVYSLNQMFRADEDISIEHKGILLERLVLISQEITDGVVRDEVGNKVKLLLQRRIREFQRYLPDETTAQDVVSALDDKANLIMVLDTFKRLFKIAMEREKILPRMYRSIVRRLVSIYGTISSEEIRRIVRTRTDELLMEYSPRLINHSEIEPFLDVTFSIANYKDNSLRQMAQILSEVNTREELLTMLRQLVLVSISRPNNVSIKRTIFSVLVARLGPEHLGRKLDYLLRGEDKAFRTSLRYIIKDAIDVLQTLPPNIKVRDIFESIKRQVNGGLNLSIIDFEKLQRCYIASEEDPSLKESEILERNEFLRYLREEIIGREMLISRRKIEQRIERIRNISADVSKAGTELERFTLFSSGLLGLVHKAVHTVESESLIADIIFQAEREELIKLYEKPSINPEWDEERRIWEENLRTELLRILVDKKFTKLSEVLLELISVVLNYDANKTILKNGRFYNFRAFVKYLAEWGRDIPMEDLIKLFYFEMRLAKIAYSKPTEYQIVRTRYLGEDFHVRKALKALHKKKLTDIEEELREKEREIKTAFLNGEGIVVCGIPIIVRPEDKSTLEIGEKDFLKEPVLDNLDISELGELTEEEFVFISLLAIAISEPSKVNIEDLNRQRHKLLSRDNARAEILFRELLKVLDTNTELKGYPGHRYARIILKQNYDIIIVGFGPAGASAAITAKRRMPKAKILVIEVQPRGHRKECAGILEERAIWGIAELLGPEKFQEFQRQHLVPTTYVRAFGPDGSKTESYSKRHVADRGILNVFLREVAEELDIDFLDQHSVEDITGFNPKEEGYDNFTSVKIKSKTDEVVSLNVKGRFVLLGTGYKGDTLFKKIGMEREKANIGAAKVAYIPADEKFIEKYFGRRDEKGNLDLVMEIHWFTEDAKQGPPTNYGWILPKRDGVHWYLDVGVGGFGRGQISTELLHKFIAKLRDRIAIDKEYQDTMRKTGLRGFGGGGIVRFKSMPSLDKEHLVVIGSSGGIEHPFADDGIGVSILSGMRAVEEIEKAIDTGRVKLENYTDTMHSIVHDQERYGLPVQQLFLKNPKLVSYIVKHANKDFLTQAIFTKLLSSEFDPDPLYRSRHFKEMVILFTTQAILHPRFLWQFVMVFTRAPILIFKLARLVIANIKLLIEVLYILTAKKYLGFRPDEPLDIIKSAIVLMSFNAKKKVRIHVSEREKPSENFDVAPRRAFEIIIGHLKEGYSVYFADGYFTIKLEEDRKRHFTRTRPERIERPRITPAPKDERKTILITGATGQVGSHMAYYFANKGYRVIATDRPKKVKYKFEHPNIEALVLDITDFDSFVNLLNREHVDLIVNSAAVIRGSLKEQLEINAYAAQSIATEAVNRNIPFFQISTASVYGLGNVINIAEDTQIVRPDSTYNVSKLMGEQLVKEIADNRPGSPVIILRLPVVYGRSRKIQGFNRLLWAIRNRLLPFYLTTPPSRPVEHSYVDARVTIPSAVEFLFKHQEKDKVYGEIFNIANPRPVQYIPLIERIKEVMGRRMPFNIYLPFYIIRPLMSVGVWIIRAINTLLPKDWEITIDFELNYINSLYYNFTVSTKKLEDLGFRFDAPTFFTELPDLVGHFHDAIKPAEQHNFQAKVKTVDIDAEVKELSDVINITPSGDLVLGKGFEKFCEDLNLKPSDVENILRLAFSMRKQDIKDEISGLRFRLSGSYTHLFGDHVRNRIVTLNDKALKGLPESSRLLAVAVGLTHEVLGHEQDIHDEEILTEKDVNLTQILAILLDFSLSSYISDLEGILVREESPYLLKLPKLEGIPFSLLNKMPIIEGLVYHYILFAKYVLLANGVKAESYMDIETAILAKLDLVLTPEEERYLKGLIGLLWRNRDILQLMVNARIQSFPKEKPSDVDASIREAIADIKTNVELGYSKESPGLLIFDLDKLLEDTSYIDMLKEIKGDNFRIVVVNHDTSKPIQRRALDRELKSLTQRVITVDAYRLRQHKGTDLGNAIVSEALSKAASELKVAEIPRKNIVLAIQPVNISIYPEDILKGLTLLILSSTRMRLTDEQMEALKRIYPEIESHLRNGRELLFLQEVHYNMQLLQQIREAREEIKKQA